VPLVPLKGLGGPTTRSPPPDLATWRLKSPVTMVSPIRPRCVMGGPPSLGGSDDGPNGLGAAETAVANLASDVHVTLGRRRLARELGVSEHRAPAAWRAAERSSQMTAPRTAEIAELTARLRQRTDAGAAADAAEREAFLADKRELLPRIEKADQ